MFSNHNRTSWSRGLLEQAIAKYQIITGTPVFDSNSYTTYQTREYVMMVKDQKQDYEMSKKTIILPTPHLSKLKALINTRRVPESDKPRIDEAIERYKQQIPYL